MSFSCTDKDTLIAYVYDECDAAARNAVETHLSTCAACADEVGGFSKVRTTLADWAPPGGVGSFRLVRDGQADAPTPARVLRPARWWQSPLPVLARAAAAILLFAGGAALANLEVRYDKEGFVVRTGWQKAEASIARETASQPAPAPVPAAPAPAVAPASVERRGEAEAPWRAELASVERQLRDEFRQQLTVVRAAGAGTGAAALPAGADAFERRILTNVQAMIDDSAQRQQLMTAYRLNQVVAEFQTQWRADLVRARQTGGTLPAVAPTQQREINRPLFPVTLKKK